MKLYFIEGIRHSAIVMAANQKEAVEFAGRAYEKERAPGVLYGSVGDWEVPVAHELKLPKGFHIAERKKNR